MAISAIKHGPLTERKEFVSRRASLLRQEAERLVGRSNNFSLGRNHFTVYTAPQTDRKIVAEVISQLTIIFQDKFIGVWFERRPADRLGIVVKVSEVKARYLPDRFINSERDLRYLVFTLDFEIGNDHLLLNWIHSQTKRKGRGGLSLAMLHNLAQALNLKKIVFLVDTYNEDAKAFYLHMKFGLPLDKERTQWQVKL